MIRTFIWFIYFWLYQFFLIPVLFYVKILALKHNTKKHDEIIYRITRRWSRSLVKMTGSTIRVVGQQNIPKSGPVVYVSNHQGNFDIPILMGYINKPKAFIAKIEIQKLPFVRTWMKNMNCVFMDRKDIRQSIIAINNGIDFVKKGYSFVIFPEGTRSRSNSIGDFKPGSFRLALKAGVPIVPVTIKGSYKIMEQNGFLIKPATVDVFISPALQTNNISKEEAKNIPITIKNIISSNL